MQWSWAGTPPSPGKRVPAHCWQCVFVRACVRDPTPVIPRHVAPRVTVGNTPRCFAASLPPTFSCVCLSCCMSPVGYDPSVATLSGSLQAGGRLALWCWDCSCSRSEQQWCTGCGLSRFGNQVLRPSPRPNRFHLSLGCFPPVSGELSASDDRPSPWRRRETSPSGTPAACPLGPGPAQAISASGVFLAVSGAPRAQRFAVRRVARALASAFLTRLPFSPSLAVLLSSMCATCHLRAIS